MTLILALGNIDQIIQISDRRLIRDGVLVDDESNKAGVFSCSNARLIFGYTGLAKYGSFATQFWLLENLAKLGQPDFQAGSILERLKAKATEDFDKIQLLSNVPLEHKRLSIMFSGYLYHYSPPRAGNAIITNFQDLSVGQDSNTAWTSFQSNVLSEKIPTPENPWFIRSIGAWSAVQESDLNPLIGLLIERKPAKAIVNKAVKIIRNIADRPQAGGAIGMQLSSIVLPRDRDSHTIAEYHTAKPKSVVYMPSMVISTPEMQLAMGDPELESSEDPNKQLIIFPKTGRNKPCPCGSGKKYKKCHGSSLFQTRLDFFPKDDP